MWIKVTIIIDINNQSIALEHSNQFKDLGILVGEKLSFKDHIQDKINMAVSMLGIIKRNFKHQTTICWPRYVRMVKQMALEY